jgi:FKBP-type peptidyl-prolyl cis-trans isomerase 2
MKSMKQLKLPFRWIVILWSLIWIGVAFCACTTMGVRSDRVVMPGETVQVDYTCRMADNAVISTNQPGQLDADEVLSNIYQPPKNSASWLVTAVDPGRPCPPCEEKKQKKTGLHDHLRLSLAEQIVHTIYGRLQTVRLTAEVPERMMDPEARYLSVTRVRRRPKVESFAIRMIEHAIGHRPQLGESFVMEEGFTGLISALDRGVATLQVTAQPGTVVHTPMGPGTIYDRGDRYEVEIDAQEGQLVRFDDMVGVIEKVAERAIHIDIGHPFGGEELICTIRTEPDDAHAKAN